MKKIYFLILFMLGLSFSQIHDVGVLRIATPVDTIKEDTLIFPRVIIANFGIEEETFQVLFKITNDLEDSIYYYQINTLTLSAGEIVEHSFDQGWQTRRGHYIVRCSTMLSIDENPSNDYRDSGLFVVYRDVGVERIVEPVDTVLEGSVVMPRVRIVNLGNVDERFPIVFRINRVGGGSAFTLVDTVVLAAGQLMDYTFTESWRSVRGSYNVSCSTMLPIDMNNLNDKVESLLFVISHDLMVLEILEPTERVLPGTVVTPRTKIRNNGTEVEKNFQVMFRIENVYLTYLTIDSLLPGVDSTISFLPLWRAVPGYYTVSCSVLLINDIDPSNDKVSSSVRVLAHDVGILSIIQPRDSLLEGIEIYPQVVVKNYGDSVETFDVRFKIGEVYNRVVRVFSLEPGSERIITFPSWTTRRGSYVVSCSTELPNDDDRNNDKQQISLFVYTYDIGVIQILEPKGYLQEGCIVFPKAKVKNFGSRVVSCSIYFAIGDSWRKTYISSLLPDSEKIITFAPSWRASRGFYIIKCSTALIHDVYPNNDVMIDSIKVFPVFTKAIYFQDFNSSWSTLSPPSGWRIFFTGDVSENDWHRKSSNEAPWTQNSTSYAAIFYRYTSDSPDSFISPIINCEVFRNVFLRVNTNFRKRGNNYRAKLVGRDNSTDRWYLIKEYTENFGPAIDSFRLPWADNKSQVEFAFVFEGNMEDIYYWCLDDFELYGDTVYNYDVTVLQANSPKSFELPRPTPVSCKIANIGLRDISVCTTIVLIKDTFGNFVYHDTAINSISRGETLTINFDNWFADTGHYQVKFFNQIGGDENPFNDTLTYSCYVNWEKLYHYDDGVAYQDTAFYLFDQGIGVRYIPELYPATIKEIHLYLQIDTISYANRFKIRIVKDDGTDSLPGTLLYETQEIAGFTGWNCFRLPIPLTINSGGFYIFYIQTDDIDNTPKLVRDRARSLPALNRYYFIDDGDSLFYKRDLTNGDWMIRVVIDYREYAPPPFPDCRVNFVYRPRGELSLRPRGIRYKPIAVIQNISAWRITNVPVSCTIYDSLMNVIYNSYHIVPSLESQEVLWDTFLPYWQPQFGGKYYVKFKTHVPGDNNPTNDTATKVIYIAPPLYTGGPDHGLYRYFWIDSDTIGGPQFNWIDTTNTFRLITEGDNAIVGINLPFNFKFYNGIYNYLWIGVDGFIAFGERPVGTGSNTPIPYYMSPNNAIFAYWDDLICGQDFGGGSISYKVIGERPERKVVVIYQNMRRKGTNYRDPKAGISFEIILHENGNILIQYLDVNCGDRRFNHGRSASVGIEDSTGNIGLEYLYGEGKNFHNYPSNKLSDSLAILFYRYFQDCGIVRLISPRKSTFVGEIRPNYLVKNLGTLNADTLKGYVKIFDNLNNLIYFDSVITNLNINDSANLIFSPISLSYGRYTILCSLWTKEDIYPGNDTLKLNFEVNKWIELAPIPKGRYNRGIKWGAMVYIPSEKRIYALKGANTNEFWYYDIEKDTWDTLPSLPDSSIYTHKRRKVKYGCAMTYSPIDNRIYVIKGGKSQEFYAFNLITKNWIELCTIPKLSSTFMVHTFDKGAALVYEQNTQMIYAIKGGNSNEFWAYNPITNNWTVKPEIPKVPSLKNCGAGAAMTAGGGKIYLVKGRNTFDFYSYDPVQEIWEELRPVTYKPSGKKVTRGAAITYYNNKVYLIKGGNSQDFVSYDIFGDSWIVRDTIPRGPYNRKIKTGGAMTCSDEGIIYLFKGGNSSEFWAYTTHFDTIVTLSSPQIKSSVMEEEIKKLEESFGIKIYPNPTTKILYFKVNKSSGIKEIKIYNSQGSVVKNIKIDKEGIYSWNFKKEGIPKGIYIIKIKGKEEKKIKVILM